MEAEPTLWEELDHLSTSHAPLLFSVYCLRLLIAPFIEYLILADRVAYLQENGFRAYLHPLFDPAISPRNFVVIAMRPS